MISAYLGFILYKRSRSAEQKNQMIKRKAKKNGRNHLYHLYVIFTSVPFLRGYFLRMRNRLRIIYPADEISINAKATASVLRALIICTVATIAVNVIASGDLYFSLAGSTIVYILFMVLTEKTIETTEIKLTKQLANFVDSVREQYNRVGRVDDAVAFTLDGLPYEISLHATKIHEALISTDITKAANDYVFNAPNKFFMTLMAICALTMENGDKRSDTGESVFLKNLNFLKEEINVELLKMQRNDALFSGLSLVAISAIVTIRPIEIWAIGNMPEMASIYKGSYGIIAMTLVFLFSAVSYTIVDGLKRVRSDNTKDTSFYRTVAEIPFVARFLNGLVSRKYTKCLRWNDMLRFTGDRQGVNTFLAKRFIIAILAMVASAFIVTTSTIQDKHRQIKDFSDAFDTSMIESKEYREVMESVAVDTAVELVKMGVDVNGANYEKELIKTIMTDTDVQKEAMAKMVASAVIVRVKKYNAIYFKWYFLFAIFGSAFLGYMAPLWILIFKHRAVQMTMEDEVNQFQTIILMLIHTDGINTITILEWMERFAFCFKDSISQCIIDLPHKGQDALKEMQYKESFPSFQSLMNSMIAIDDVGVETAFSSIETDRAYLKEKRKEDNEIMMNRKASIGRWVALFPLAFAFAAYLIYPLINMAQSMMSQIQSAV